MTNIQASLENIIKTNNGYFKSQKQADFLLDQLAINNSFIVYSMSNALIITYRYDGKGITEKVKTSQKTGKESIEFQRKIKGVLNEVDKKEIKKLERKLKVELKSYNAAIESFNNGDYFTDDRFSIETMTSIFNKSRENDMVKITAIKNKIAAIKNA